jgi:hypothetical protein
MEIHKRKTLEDFPKFVVTGVRPGATSEAGYTPFELEGGFDGIPPSSFNHVVDGIGPLWFWLVFGMRGYICASVQSHSKETNGGWPIFAVTILTEAAPAFLLLESWAPPAFAPPIFSLLTEPWRGCGKHPQRERVSVPSFRKERKLGQPRSCEGMKTIEAVAAPRTIICRKGHPPSASAPQEVDLVGPVHSPGLVRERN